VQRAPDAVRAHPADRARVDGHPPQDVEQVFGSKGDVMLFDGVALLTITGGTARASTEGRRQLTAWLSRGIVVGLPCGSRAVTYRPAGFPDHLPAAAAGEDVVLTGLRRPGPSTSDVVELRRIAGRTAAGPWALADVALMPPASTDDLLAVQPLPAGRIHLGLRRCGSTACGRLPARGPERAVASLDCRRCLTTPIVAARHDAQLRAYPDLVALVGPLIAAAAARLSRRLQHRDPCELPAILDAAVGSLVHGFPGAGTTDEVLELVTEHREHASGSARAWAADVARGRVERGLASRRRRRATGLGDGLPAAAQRLAGLLPPPEAADLLLALLEEFGPDPGFEPVVLAAARRAGDAASDRVQHWRRLHELAAALAGPSTHTSVA
jgi:hypothetical protein